MVDPDRGRKFGLALWRWREALSGGILGLFGLWAALTGYGITQLLGYAFVVAGAVVTFAGIQRTRFRIGAGGPGMVVVREAEVTYFGPHDGGTVNVGSLARLELDRAARPFPVWILTEEGQAPVHIPTTAENAEALFDVFASLPGIETERMLGQLNSPSSERVLIWQSAGRRPRIGPVQ